MDYIKKAFVNYADFKGRASRKEFWYFTLFNLVVSIFLAILNINLLIFIYFLIIFIPALSLSIRRLHDVNKSGWWVLPGVVINFFQDFIIKLIENKDPKALFIIITFLVYGIWMLYLNLKKGDLFPNKYGV